MADESSKPSRLLAWLQLMRLPNVFTAMTDIFMGFWFTHETLSPRGTLVLLLISSSCLYTSGMILNDVYDVEQDRRERPQRPIPSGRIQRHSAVVLGSLMFTWGLLAASMSTKSRNNDWRLAFVILCLACLILAYNRILKRTPIGPVAMGGCRFFNVLLGMSASPQPWSTANYAVAGGIGIYIVGITWFARREATTSLRFHLVGGLITMLSGMVLLWCFPKLLPSDALILAQVLWPRFWTLFWLALAALIGWRFVRAVLRPQPAMVQAAVKSGILSIIVLDAAVVFGMRGCWPAIAMLSLLIPAIFLGRWVYST